MPGPLDLLRRVTKLTARSRFGYDELPPRTAQLFDRLAAEAPVTAEVFHPGPLSHALLRSAVGGRRTDNALLRTTPDDFLSLAAPLEQSRSSKAQVDALRNMLAARESRLDAYDDSYYMEALPKFRGFGDVPFLVGDSSLSYPRVIGHEGRHRMNAIGELYGWDTPLAIRGLGAWQPGRVVPENIDQRVYENVGLGDSVLRLMRPAPEQWAHGGRVHA